MNGKKTYVWCRTQHTLEARKTLSHMCKRMIAFSGLFSHKKREIRMRLDCAS